MRILFYLHSLGAGGAERVVSTLANYWAANGHEVMVVTLAEVSTDFYRTNARVTRVALDLGVPRATLPARIVDSIRRIWRLRRVLRRSRPRLAIAMMDSASVSLAFAGLGLSEVVCVGSERIYPPFSDSSLPWRLLRRWTYRLLHGVVAQSDENVCWLRQHTLARRTWVIPNPVVLPLESASPHRAPGEWRTRPRRALAVGRYVTQKGFDLLIKAFASIADRFPEWELVIVGEGPERDRLVELSRSNGSWERIWLAGPVGNITDWYASADLFVLSSRFEGFPNTLLEAMAHGLPAIAADCLTGPRALITHEFDGVLVPPDDVVGLAEGMMRLMGDDAMRRLFGERASVAGERFSIERVGAMWTNIISGEGL